MTAVSELGGRQTLRPFTTVAKGMSCLSGVLECRGSSNSLQNNTTGSLKGQEWLNNFCQFVRPA